MLRDWEKIKRWLVIHGSISLAVIVFSFLVTLVIGALLVRTAAIAVVGFTAGKVAAYLDRVDR